MIKKIILLSISIFLLNCSLNSNSEFWNNKNKKVLKKNEKKENINYVKKINLNENLTYSQFKEKFINYGKVSNFPNISD
tara:strand:- start:1 stop:237 length:237 start_codon:yes stop_codon:yes gene_type:complete